MCVEAVHSGGEWECLKLVLFWYWLPFLLWEEPCGLGKWAAQQGPLWSSGGPSPHTSIPEPTLGVCVVLGLNGVSTSYLSFAWT